MKKRIVFARDLPSPDYLQVLSGRPDILIEKLPEDPEDPAASALLLHAHGYQITSARGDIDQAYVVSRGLLERMPDLLVVSTNGVGFDTVDVAACTSAGVLAVNQAGGNREAVAEHALAMMLCLSKRIIETDRYMRRRSGIRRGEFKGHDIFGKTLGVIGFGAIGSRLAEMGRVFSMRTLAYDPYVSSQQMAALGAAKVELDELLSEADFVSVHCPLTQETLGMIGRREYGLMRRGAIFVNTARGGIHDECALAEALEQGAIAGAGLDVWAHEPPPSDHPLLAFDNVLVSPHTAGVTYEARSHIATIAAQQLLRALSGERPPRLLNPEVWPSYARRYEAIFGVAPAQ